MSIRGTSRRAWSVAFAAVAALACGGAFAQPAADPAARASYIDKDFVLFWPNPVRAHPGVPLDFRFVAYEADNRKLTWELKGAPAGIAIDDAGRVSWTPKAADAGAHKMSVRVTRKPGDSIERAFTLTVSTGDFLFVSPAGNDANPGTLEAPLATIERAMRLVQSGDGKTIYLRGGTYAEHYNWEVGNVQGPWRGKRFAAEDPAEVRSFPGERAVLDCEGAGHGLTTTDHCIIDNLEVKNAGALERGGLWLSGEHVMVRDVVVHDSHWSVRANCTGYLIHARDVVLDHTVGYNNRDPRGRGWNSSNYLAYTEHDPGNIYILNSTSYGSVSGFKIKHAGPGRLIVHNCRSIGEPLGYAGASAWSSVRYSVFLNSGVQLGVTDPNPWTAGPVLFEHNTVVNAQMGVFVQDGYLKDGVLLRRNLIYNDLGAATRNEDRPNWLMTLWMYRPDVEGLKLTASGNLLCGPSENDVVRWGRGYRSFAEWTKAMGGGGNVFAAPGFKDPKAGNLSLPADSPARLADGDFAGAFPPGTDYPPVAVDAPK